jgi:hypothetical protein
MRIMGDAPGSIIAIIMTHHIINIKKAYPEVQTAGFIMAMWACSIIDPIACLWVTCDSSIWFGIAMSDDVCQGKLRDDISKAVIPIPAPVRM